MHWYHGHWQVIQEVLPNYFFSFFGSFFILKHGVDIQGSEQYIVVYLYWEISSHTSGIPSNWNSQFSLFTSFSQYVATIKTHSLVYIQSRWNTIYL